MVKRDTLLSRNASIISSTHLVDTPCQVHLNKILSHAALQAAILLNDGDLKKIHKDFDRRYNVSAPYIINKLPMQCFYINTALEVYIKKRSF